MNATKGKSIHAAIATDVRRVCKAKGIKARVTSKPTSIRIQVADTGDNKRNEYIAITLRAEFDKYVYEPGKVTNHDTMFVNYLFVETPAAIEREKNRDRVMRGEQSNEVVMQDVMAYEGNGVYKLATINPDNLTGNSTARYYQPIA